MKAGKASFKETFVRKDFAGGQNMSPLRTLQMSQFATFYVLIRDT